VKTHPKIFADFNNTDKRRCLRLNTRGALEDIENQNIKLEEGLEVLLYDHDELETLGVVESSLEENIWVARIDWSLIM